MLIAIADRQNHCFLFKFSRASFIVNETRFKRNICFNITHCQTKNVANYKQKRRLYIPISLTLISSRKILQLPTARGEEIGLGTKLRATVRFVICFRLHFVHHVWLPAIFIIIRVQTVCCCWPIEMITTVLALTHPSRTNYLCLYYWSLKQTRAIKNRNINSKCQLKWAQISRS